MLIATIVGARPQFVKATAVSRALRSRSGVTERLIHTGQHYDANMSEVFFQELGIPRPDRILEVGSGPHGQQTGRMLEALECVLGDERPDWVLIYGDTNSTLAGALAAAKLQIPVAHVEAGLRSFNRRMPEEINRVIADHLATLCFAPTSAAVSNLGREGIAGDQVVLVGDVMYDVARFYGQCAEGRQESLTRHRLRPQGYVLATIHRAENTDDRRRLSAIIDGLCIVAREIPVLVPLHPRTRLALERAGLSAGAIASLITTPPVGYLDMVFLEKHAAAIVTDSGGVQKEAFFHGIPCVTLRDETEWTELIEIGANRLCPPESSQAVAEAIRHALATPPPSSAASLYGDGTAAEKIVDALASFH